MRSSTPHPGGLPDHIARKIVPLDRLVALRAELRQVGRQLVQCHGCFDIVHPGHIRHLRQARTLGDCLLVSITGDPAIRKGTGRPLIPEELRAENLAAIDCVDYVVIDTCDTAQKLLERIRPDVYVKGKEYETNNDPRFKAERETVEKHGGRVVFSSGDVVFSSTALIAALEQSADPYHHRLVELTRRDDLSGPALYQSLQSIRGRSLVVVGECITDTYILCDRPDIASESPVMTLRPLEARHYDGGAAVVARHAAAMGAKVTLVTALPDSREAESLRERMSSEGITVRAVRTSTPLAEKQRFLVGAQKVMKLDLVEPVVLDASQQESLLGTASEACGSNGCDAAIITDFGLGLFSPKTLTRLCRVLRSRARVLSGDVSGRRSSLRAMTGMDLLCPSESELREAMGLHSEGLPLVVWKLLERTASANAIVTLGADGLIAFSRLPEPTDAIDGAWHSRLTSEHVPALVPIALDPLGCGDALLTASTLGLAAGANLTAAAFLGAAAAAVQVQRLGNLPVNPHDLRRIIARVHSSHLVYDAEAARPDATNILLRAS